MLRVSKHSDSFCNLLEVELKPDTRHLKPSTGFKGGKWMQLHCNLSE